MRHPGANVRGGIHILLLLTCRTRHFPLSYEGVPGLEIGMDQWTQIILNGILEVVLGRLDEIPIMFSSSA